jgi:peptide/nickel transport system substrate-binding protein
MFKPWKSTLVVLVAVTLTAAPALAQERLLRVRLGADISGVDPAKIFSIENQTLANQVYSGLVRYAYEKDGAIVPDLAEKWDLSADGKTYTFQLRKGVKWHKGYGELTADDVKFSYDRVLDPSVNSRYKGEFKLVESVEVVGPHTVRIRLKNKYPGFLNKIAAYNQGFVISKKAMEKLGDQYATNPIGTGPFVFESWAPKNQVVLLANKEYFGGAPKLDRVILRVIPEETTAEIALQRGEIDVFYALQNAEVIGRLSKASGVTVHRRTANHTINMVLNQTFEPFAKVEVRRAMAHALNLKALRESFFNGLKDPPHWVLTTSFPENAKDLTEYPRSRSRESAAEESGASERLQVYVHDAWAPAVRQDRGRPRRRPAACRHRGQRAGARAGRISGGARRRDAGGGDHWGDRSRRRGRAAVDAAALGQLPAGPQHGPLQGDR